ncbi:MAG: hypothetical protein QXX41_04870 [Nitrososphaerota archaeon]
MSGEFNVDDVEYFIMKIQPLSFNVGLKFEFYQTLQILEEEFMTKLEKVCSKFSELNEEKRNLSLFISLP